MRITAADVVVTSPSRNFVTLRITTDDGLTGLGDATLNGRELAVVSYLRDHVAQLLLGRDPHRIEDTWQFLYRSAYWRRGPVTMAAIAAVDMALWDIKGKAAGLPVYQLLGGASRTGLRAYGHASGTDLESLFDSIRHHLDEQWALRRTSFSYVLLPTRCRPTVDHGFEESRVAQPVVGCSLSFAGGLFLAVALSLGGGRPCPAACSWSFAPAGTEVSSFI